MSNVITKDKLEYIEEQMLLSGIPETECPVTHHFSNNVYVREILMPTGTLVLGHEHKTKHLNIISKGTCLLADIVTGDVTTISAPYTFESDVGVRKLLYIIEDCVWSTVHVTDETNLLKLEEQLIIKSETNLLLKNTNKIGGTI